VKPKTLLRKIQVHVSPLARVASDHLPLTAQLDLRCGTAEPLPDLEQPAPASDSRSTQRSA
jgi:hypothetical protein